MKMWKVVSVVEIICFILISVFLWFRRVDGAGIANTLENKLISIGIVAIVLVVLLIIQGVWYFSLNKQGSKS